MLEKISNFNPKMLKWAREQSHLTLDIASERLDIDIDAIEKGQLLPSYVELRKMADLYNKPLSVFFLPQPPLIKNLNASCRTIPSQVYMELSPNVIKMIDYARLMQLNLYELHNNKNDKIYRFNFLKDNIESLEKIRNHINFTYEIQIQIKKEEEVFKYIREQLHDIGIYIFKESFQDKDVSGFCLHDNEFPVIMINNNNTFTRQIFTVFHELYHLIIGTSGLDFINDENTLHEYKNNSDYSEELKANDFAANILISIQEINKNIYRKEDISYDSIRRISSKYKISREVVTRQLYSAKMIDYDDMMEYIYDFRDDYKRINRDKSGGNYYSNKISYLGENYLKLAYSKYYNGEITSRDLTKYVKMNIKSTSFLAEYKGWGTV